MQFKYLSEIGSGYLYEEGTQGVRNAPVIWNGIQTKLKQAIVDLKNLTSSPAPAPTASTGGKTVKDLVKFHEAKQQQHAPQAAMEEARRKVDYYRRWLSMEGAAADKDGNIDVSKFKSLTVVYDHDLARQGMTQVRIIGGRLFMDDAGRNPLGTENMVTHFSGPGKAIYSMSATGSLHVASHVVGHYHHSSLLAAADVGCAGELEAVGGSLVWLSNKSGHYRPNVGHMLQILHLLQKAGVPMTFRLTVCSTGPPKMYSSVGEFLKELEMDDEPDYELMKLMAYSADLTDTVLQRNGWRWRTDPTSEKAGVYVIATGAPVPHREVRQWLKGQGLSARVETQSGVGR